MRAPFLSLSLSRISPPLPSSNRKHTEQRHWEDIYSWIRNYTVAAMLPFRTIGWKLPSRFSESYILGYGPSYFTIFFRPILFLFSLLFLSPFFTTLFPSPEMQILRLFELQNAELCVQTKRERGKKENKQTEKKKRFHKDRTRFEKPRCRPFIVSVVYFRNASFCHCFVECKRQEKLRGEIRSRIRNVHAIWYAIKFINRIDDANIFVACENNFLIRQRCKRCIRL